VAYYEALKLPASADEYIAGVKKELEVALAALDRSMPQNPYVKVISSKKGGSIRLSELEPQPEPANLLALKLPPPSSASGCVRA